MLRIQTWNYSFIFTGSLYFHNKVGHRVPINHKGFSLITCLKVIAVCFLCMSYKADPGFGWGPFSVRLGLVRTVHFYDLYKIYRVDWLISFNLTNGRVVYCCEKRLPIYIYFRYWHYAENILDLFFKYYFSKITRRFSVE